MYLDRWVLVFFNALSTLVAGTLSVRAWHRRQNPLGYHFFLAVFIITIYNFGYMCELASDNLATIRFWLRIESIGIAFLPTVWIILIVSHTNAQIKYWPQLKAFLIMMSTITFILSNTSELHHLHYGPLNLNPEAPFPIVNFVPGPWYWVYTAFTNLMVLWGNILFAQALLKAPSDKRLQAFVLFLGSLFPWVVYIAYLLKLIPWGIDPLPIAFLVPEVLYAWAVFGLKMLEISPIARQVVFQKLSDGVLVFDQEGRLIDFNAAGKNVFSKLNVTAIGKSGRELFCEYPALISIIGSPTDDLLAMWLEFDDEKVNYQLQRIELFDRENHMVGFMVILRDITHFSDIVEGLQIQAAIDPLTQILNRGRLKADGEALVEKARSKQGVISLILLDLDDFKKINDTYGHIAGDYVLREFVQTCRKKLRAQDVFGRYGGDEFVIILPDLVSASVIDLAKRLQQAVEKMTVMVNEQEIRVTASFGVVTEQVRESTRLEQLAGKADQALYEAKNAGGNQVQVYQQG